MEYKITYLDRLINDFLLDGKQYVTVTVGNECSDVRNVISGVHQGSVLGPTLFIYIL